MRVTRSENEGFFTKIFLNYVRNNYDAAAVELPEVKDRPDLAISSQGKTIGIEFSQCPGDYIIREFHRKFPETKHTENGITGQLTIYPYEPHRWVHQVLRKKHKKAAAYTRRINADEIWLVLHSHSINDDWPMTPISREEMRKLEALWFRFGAKGYGKFFDRVFYCYADGSVLSLSGGEEEVPTSISLPDTEGYPALTSHFFSFSFNVPLPGLGVREYRIEEIQFAERIITPKDDWMAGRVPNIDRPAFSAEARVSADQMDIKVYRGGKLCLEKSLDSRRMIGKAYRFDTLVHSGKLPRKSSYTL